MKLADLQRELRKMRDPKKADFLARYFKTGKGQYAEGDVFLGGISTAISRTLAKKYRELSLIDISKLIKSKYHEERSVSLGILKHHFLKTKYKKEIYRFYLKNTQYINNWDLVDISAPTIIGGYLLENPEELQILNKLAHSKNLWKRRIAVLATFTFIKYKKFAKSLEIAKILLKDKEDLIHKAVGWMLREIGKRDMMAEEKFLKKYYKVMPRTMLRYAIEKFPEPLRKKYLLGQI